MFVIIIVLLLGFLLVTKTRKNKKRVEPTSKETETVGKEYAISFSHTYYRKRCLFSPAERSFLGVLQMAVSDKQLIFGKVRVADIIGVGTLNTEKIWWQAFVKISSKHFDFVICDKDDLSIKCVIELDDNSHQSSDRTQRDQFLNEISSAVKLPLLRVPTQASYSLAAVKQNLERTFSK